jgi:hypothetical protein
MYMTDSEAFVNIVHAEQLLTSGCVGAVTTLFALFLLLPCLHALIACIHGPAFDYCFWNSLDRNQDVRQTHTDWSISHSKGSASPQHTPILYGLDQKEEICPLQ